MFDLYLQVGEAFYGILVQIGLRFVQATKLKVRTTADCGLIACNGTWTGLQADDSWFLN